jgi:hypothetical protein
LYTSTHALSGSLGGGDGGDGGGAPKYAWFLISESPEIVAVIDVVTIPEDVEIIYETDPVVAVIDETRLLSFCCVMVDADGWITLSPVPPRTFAITVIVWTLFIFMLISWYPDMTGTLMLSPVV